MAQRKYSKRKQKKYTYRIDWRWVKSKRHCIATSAKPMAQMHQKTDEIGCKSKEKKLYIETKTSNLAKLLNVYMIYMAAAIAIVCHFDEKKSFFVFFYSSVSSTAFDVCFERVYVFMSLSNSWTNLLLPKRRGVYFDCSTFYTGNAMLNEISMWSKQQKQYLSALQKNTVQ